MAKKSNKLRENLKGLFSKTEADETTAESIQEESTTTQEVKQKSVPKEEPQKMEAAETKQSEPKKEEAPVKKEEKKSAPARQKNPAKKAQPKKTDQPAPQPKKTEKAPAANLIVKDSKAIQTKEDAAIAAAKKEDAEDESMRQVVVFSIDGDNYGVSVLPIRTIIKPFPVFVVPGTLPFIKGLINLRGEVIPIFDLRMRLGLPEKEIDDLTRFVVVETQDKVGGLIVDEIKGVMNIPESSFETPSKVVMDVDTRYLSDVARYEETIVLILDLRETLLADQDLGD